MSDPGVGQDLVLEESEDLGLYALAEARDQLDDVPEPQRYSRDRIKRAHDACKALFEDECGKLFISETEPLKVDAEGSTTLFLPRRRVTAVANVQVDLLDGNGLAAYAGTVLEVGDSYIVGDTAFAAGAVVQLDVTHGHASVPADIKEAALTYLKDQVLGGAGRVGDTALPARTRAYATDGLQVELARPSKDAPTGNPDVDRILARHQEEIRDLSAAGGS